MSVGELISAIAPQYANDSRVAAFTTIATNNTSRTRFGANYEYAIALRVCHMIARNPLTQPGTPGAVTAASEGGVSQSYAIPDYLKSKFPDLCSTPYGCQLADLIDGNIVGQLAVGGIRVEQTQNTGDEI
jgi:hypothetical protein